MDYYYYLIILLGLLLFAWIHTLSKRRRSTSKNKNLPPGPNPLPVIGNLHLLGEKPNQSLARLAGKYGPVMILRMGMINTVIISSASAAKEALTKQDLAFSGRSTPHALRALSQLKPSVVWLPVGLTWRTLRKFMSSSIFSGNKLDANQELRARKIEELIKYCRKKSEEGKAVDIGREAFKTTLNTLSNTIFSKDLSDPNSDAAEDVKELVWNIMAETGKFNLVDYFPFLESFDPQGIKRRMNVHFNRMIDFFKGLIDQRLEQRKNSNNNDDEDVLDSLINLSQEKPDEIDRNHIERMCWDLLVAGTDTSSSTIEWAMAELLKHPEAMAKAQAELEEVIGKGKVVSEADLTRLPYLQCVVKETFRLHPPTPFLIPRQVDQDVVLCGYTVPEGSQVLVNVWAIGRDPCVWGNDSHEFRPEERFWGSDVDAKGRDFELIPFGAGRRICPGVPMALRTIPVMLGSLLNSFRWKVEGDVAPKDLDMEEKFGITLAKAHPLKAIPIPL